MKRNIIFAIVLLSATVSYSQSGDLIKEIQKQTLKIKELQDKLKKQDIVLSNYKGNFKKANDEKENLQKELDKLKEDKNNINKKDAEIESLKRQIKETEDNFNKKFQEQQGLCEENTKQKIKELKDKFVGVYKNLSFDELLASSSLQAVERDRQLFADYTDIQPMMRDLSSYFKALQVLNAKYDMQNVENGIRNLKTVRQSSEKVTQLLENLEYYKDYTEALKPVLDKIVKLDKNKNAGGDEEIQKMKFNEIVSILSDYLYNYKGYEKYPYINAIVRELLERKMGNADADITDLAQKI